MVENAISEKSKLKNKNLGREQWGNKIFETNA